MLLAALLAVAVIVDSGILVAMALVDYTTSWTLRKGIVYTRDSWIRSARPAALFVHMGYYY